MYHSCQHVIVPWRPLEITWERGWTDSNACAGSSFLVQDLTIEIEAKIAVAFAGVIAQV